MRRLVWMTILAAGAITAAPRAALAQGDSERAGQPGHELYMEKCAVCHGDEGAGDGPAALTMLPRPRVFKDNSNFKFRTTASGNLPTDDDLLKVITDGIYGTAMPSFRHLPEKDRRELVGYLKGFNEDFQDPENVGETIKIGKPPEITDELIERGKKIYIENKCWECHGNEGRGDGPTWADKTEKWGDKDVPIVPADMTRWHQLRCGDSIECLYKTTATGLNGTPMPNYDLPEEDRWAMSAWLASIHQPKKERQDQIIVARRLDTLPATVDDEAWQKIPEAMFYTLGQIVQKPRLFWPSVTEVFVRAAYNDEEIALLVQWHDRGLPKGKNLTEVAPDKDPVTDVLVNTDHPDQMVVQFPSGLASGAERPYFLWGDPAHEVNLWWWGTHLSGLDTGGFRDRNAKGKSDTIEDQDDASQDLKGSVVYKDGRYSMLIRRTLRTSNPRDVQFDVGLFTPIAFNIWEGNRGEVGLRRAVTSWYQIVLEPPVPATAFVAPVIAAAVTLGVLLLLVVSVRRAPAPLPRKKDLGSLGETALGQPAAGDLPEVPAEHRVGAIGVLSTIAVTGLIVYLVVVGLGALLTGAAERERDSAAKGRETEVQKLKQKQAEELGQYDWIDQGKGTVKIPVERAMDLVIDDAQQGKESLVPAVGTHDKPTLPAKFGREQPPKEGAAKPAAPATAPAPAPAPGDAAAPAPGGAQPAPAPGGAQPAPGGAQPAPGAGQPAPTGGAQPAPTGPAPAQPAPTGSAQPPPAQPKPAQPAPTPP